MQATIPFIPHDNDASLMLHHHRNFLSPKKHRESPRTAASDGSYNQLESSEVSAVKYKTSGPQITNTYVMLPGNHGPECARYVNKNYFGLTKISNLTMVRNSLLFLICVEHQTHPLFQTLKNPKPASLPHASQFPCAYLCMHCPLSPPAWVLHHNSPPSFPSVPQPLFNQVKCLNPPLYFI